jgi:hypothetical protein
MLLFLMTLYPLVATAGLYSIWLCKYIVNGERPIPPHHGASGWLEEALYLVGEVTWFGRIAVLPLTVVGTFVMLAIDGHEPRGWTRWRSLVPLVAWGLVYLLFRWDPHGVMYFIRD